MFRSPLCPSSGAQEYYTVVATCGISCCGFQVVGLVWSWGLCVRFAGCCFIQQHPANRTHNQQLEHGNVTLKPNVLIPVLTNNAVKSSILLFMNGKQVLKKRRISEERSKRSWILLNKQSQIMNLRLPVRVWTNEFSNAWRHSDSRPQKICLVSEIQPMYQVRS